VIGDTVGDPLKDTSGPSINILIKLSAIISLVFAALYDNTGVLVDVLGEKDPALVNRTVIDPVTNKTTYVMVCPDLV